MHVHKHISVCRFLCVRLCANREIMVNVMCMVENIIGVCKVVMFAFIYIFSC